MATHQQQYKKFYDMLLKYSQSDEDEGRKRIEKALWADYGQEKTVFVLDMSGFSRLTRKYGITHYLAMVLRMQLTCEPIINSYEGSVVKFEADNCFAVFPSPLQAVNAAAAMQHAFEASTLLTADELDIRVSCGIAHGNILLIEGEDCFGDAVNIACKLGEDVAEAGDILITREAMGMVPPEAKIKSRDIEVMISGITIPAYSIDYRSEG